MSRNKREKRRAADIPREIRREQVKLDTFYDTMDKIQVWRLSFSGRYDNINQLAKHTNRGSCDTNYKTLGLYKRRGYEFCNHWWQVATAEAIAEKGGIDFFKQIKPGRGRKRKLTLNQGLNLFTDFLQQIHENECELSVYQFASQNYAKYQISIRTVMRYIDIFAKERRKLIEGHSLDEANKLRRLEMCRFWDELGQEYFNSVAVSIDESVFYCNDVVRKSTTYEPKCIHYEELQILGNENKFTREVPIVAFDYSKGSENPVAGIQFWTLPPLPQQIVNFIFIFF